MRAATLRRIRVPMVAMSLAVTAAIGAGGSAGAFEGFELPKAIQRVPGNVDASIRAIAAHGHIVAVEWLEASASGIATGVRWSTDNGLSFGPVHFLAGRLGTSVAVCEGTIWVATESIHGSRTDRRVRLDGWVADGSAHTAQLLARGTAHADVGCAGPGRIALAYARRVTARDHDVLLDIRETGAGATLGPVRRSHLGTAGYRSDNEPWFGVSIAATDRDVVAAWVDGASLRLRRTPIEPSSDPRPPVVTMVADLDGGRPQLAASRRHVALAFSRSADLRVRESHDGGVAFDPPVTIVDLAPDAETRAYPGSVSVDGPRVLVGAEQDNTGADTAAVLASAGYLNDRYGVTPFTRISDHPDGSTSGVLWPAGGAHRLAEAWDRLLADTPTNRILFHRDFRCAC